MNILSAIENATSDNVYTVPTEHMAIHQYDQSCGSEYLDQALRMTDQPLKEPSITTLRTIDGLLWDL